ncbi:hypothetical protein [Flavobacterium croceum]|uniref:GLPGLI family protein n=1 Tax=Flavobacterium croceum DSM 17960 TaxID=1121886 RepID=A0A2S4N585_9FLAO|nr:hypothetical protein [Flavobacterium croceum]POS00894.1 hypothetical protein Q361_11827 [Flavobacterium croceum DSM 17960]
MFKKFTTALCLFTALLCMGQIQKAPEKYNKIIYTYKTKPNYHFDSSGIYADSTVIQNDFLKTDFKILQHPTDSTKRVGFISYKSMNKADKLVLKNKVLTYFTKTRVEYYVKLKKAIMYKTVYDLAEIPTVVKTFLDNSVTEFVSEPSTIYYLPNKEINVVNSISNLKESYREHTINWLENQNNTGVFDYNFMGKIYNCTVEVDPKLSKYIVPATSTIFANCDYGITSVKTLEFTSKLIKVEYK